MYYLTFDVETASVLAAGCCRKSTLARPRFPRVTGRSQNPNLAEDKVPRIAHHFMPGNIGSQDKVRAPLHCSVTRSPVCFSFCPRHAFMLPSPRPPSLCQRIPPGSKVEGSLSNAWNATHAPWPTSISFSKDWTRERHWSLETEGWSDAGPVDRSPSSPPRAPIHHRRPRPSTPSHRGHLPLSPLERVEPPLCLGIFMISRPNQPLGSTNTPK
ncbi:hypothetical protein CMEL01_13388 [Colletotrichum melonis]|uniref:Uncharacterized protein n=1 Tax=Colletotrichum melonis TaxID=1209925 RepID=A0AAI9URF2_9PEZI|nr:hypothetical protein CMEL01_13388 [Colletotrichum melonis]